MLSFYHMQLGIFQAMIYTVIKIESGMFKTSALMSNYRVKQTW